jgi:hypothetical protein
MDREEESEHDDWPGLLQTLLERDSVVCICTMTSATLKSLYSQSAKWRRLGQTVYIPGSGQLEVPWEL